MRPKGLLSGFHADFEKGNLVALSLGKPKNQNTLIPMIYVFLEPLVSLKSTSLNTRTCIFLKPPEAKKTQNHTKPLTGKPAP